MQRDLDWRNSEILDVRARIASTDSPSPDDQELLGDLEESARYLEDKIEKRLAATRSTPPGGEPEDHDGSAPGDATGLAEAADVQYSEELQNQAAARGASEEPTPATSSDEGKAHTIAELEAQWAEQRARVLADLPDRGYDLEKMGFPDVSDPPSQESSGRGWQIPTAIAVVAGVLVGGSLFLFTGGNDSESTAGVTTLPPTTTATTDPGLLDDPEPLDQPEPGASSGDPVGGSDQPNASQIADVRSGVWEEERFVRVELTRPSANPNQQFNLEFRSNEGDDMFASFRPAEGFTSSFCVGQTPSCPDGFFPIVAELVGGGDVIIFRFAVDAFDNSSGITIRTFIETGPDDDPLVDTFGSDVALSDDSFDPGE